MKKWHTGGYPAWFDENRYVYEIHVPVDRSATRWSSSGVREQSTAEPGQVGTGQAIKEQRSLRGVAKKCFGLGNFSIPLRQLLRAQEGCQTLAQRTANLLQLRNDIGSRNFRIGLANLIKSPTSVFQRSF